MSLRIGTLGLDSMYLPFPIDGATEDMVCRIAARLCLMQGWESYNLPLLVYLYKISARLCPDHFSHELALPSASSTPVPSLCSISAPFCAAKYRSEVLPCSPLCAQTQSIALLSPCLLFTSNMNYHPKVQCCAQAGEEESSCQHQLCGCLVHLLLRL